MGTSITETDIETLDRAAARTWRGTEEETLGGWLLRAAGGLTGPANRALAGRDPRLALGGGRPGAAGGSPGRANSVLAAGAPGLPLAAAAARVQAWYRARGLAPMA